MKNEFEICPKCSGIEIIKNGKPYGNQRYLCKSCNYRFTKEHLQKGKDKEFIIRAIQLYLEGVSLRRIGELLGGINHSTIGKWISNYCPKGNKIRRKPYRNYAATVSRGNYKIIKNNKVNFDFNGILLCINENMYLLLPDYLEH